MKLKVCSLDQVAIASQTQAYLQLLQTFRKLAIQTLTMDMCLLRSYWHVNQLIDANAPHVNMWSIIPKQPGQVLQDGIH